MIGNQCSTLSIEINGWPKREVQYQWTSPKKTWAGPAIFQECEL